jgi:uncharacterized protein YydD (DUF2326 family)
MRLISVRANQESFRTVNFNPYGLSFIVAKQKDPSTTEKGRTYNGVGKSLLVKIIHFCLGSSIRGYRSFCEKLPGWEFSLDFYIGDDLYTSTRSVDNFSSLLLNGEMLSCSAFTKRLEALCFNIPDEAEVLSFRSLLPFFIRPERSSYNSYDRPIKKQTDYQAMLLNAHLLGLDITLAQQKYRFRVETEKIKTLLKSFEKDGLLKDYSTGDKDVALKLAFLDDRIKQLEMDLSSFVIAEDYHEVQKDADHLKAMVDELHNTIILLQSNIARIDETLEVGPMMHRDELITAYNEVQVHFPERLVKTLDELQEFNDRLITTRQKRLLEQRNDIAARIQVAEQEQKRLQRELDQKMQYLGGHRALDVFITVSNMCADLKTEREKLIQFQELQKNLTEQSRQLKKELIESEQETEQYLVRMEKEISKFRDYFKELANRFYPRSVAGLSIINNDGENQLRYTIDASIESDSSDGINDVKTFCYDLTLLLKGHNHNIGFLFHDSRLYSDPDERQKAEMFTIASERFTGSPYQYIATVNQNQLEEVRRVLGDSAYNAIITPNVVLTLTDENPRAKLLGISVEIGER